MVAPKYPLLAFRLVALLLLDSEDGPPAVELDCASVSKSIIAGVCIGYPHC